MTINHKIWNFPKMGIQGQLFHVPGAYFDGGLTSGGARIMSPEPGGRSVLEVIPSLQVNEWSTPFSSWLMSKTNGSIFRIPLVKTPQLAKTPKALNSMWSSDLDLNLNTWDNGQTWDDDGFYLSCFKDALEGEVNLKISIGSFGEILKHGHLIGVGGSTHLIEDIEYSSSLATLTLNPPLRKNIKRNQPIFLKPFFIGVIRNGSEIRSTYNSSDLGAIRLNRIIFDEVLINV